MILSVITLSLVKVPQAVPVAHADKFEHLLAYGAMMYWWGMLRPGRKWFWALCLCAMGLGLEFLQQFAPGRFMEWRDAVANLVGVGIGWTLAVLPSGLLLRRLDRQFGN